MCEADEAAGIVGRVEDARDRAGPEPAWAHQEGISHLKDAPALLRFVAVKLARLLSKKSPRG